MSTRLHAQTRLHDPAATAWVTRAGPTGAVVTSSGRALAEGSVEDSGDRVVVQFWTSPGVPPHVRARLVALTFRHVALWPGRPVLVCVPAGDSEVLVRARDHVALAHTRAAGATCLVHGVVEGAVSGAPAPRARGTRRTPVPGRRPLAGSAVAR